MRRIDASRWREAIIEARLHATTNWANTCQIIIDAGPDAFTDEDPSLVWTNPGAGNIVTFTQGTDTAPTVRTGSIGGTLGYVPPLLVIRVLLVTAVGAAQRITADVSVDLNLKGE